MSAKWKAPHVDLLRRLHSEGETPQNIADQINKEFPGMRYSRSSVVTRLWRLGMIEKMAGAGAQRGKVKPRKPPVSEPLLQMTEPRTKHAVDLLGLKETTCRWPVGDTHAPDFHYCGRKPVEGSPYCLGHHARAYQKRTPPIKDLLPS